MLKEIYTAAIGMVPQQTKLEVTANNIANANTIGFKKQGVFERDLLEASQNMNNIEGDAEQFDAPIGVYTNFEKGAYQKTGAPLDFALDTPDAYFVVKDSENKKFYTRSGHFTINAKGDLVNNDGKVLEGKDGTLNLYKEFFFNPSDISDSKSLDIRLSKSGELFSKQKFIGSLEIITVENPQTLKREMNSYFLPGDQTQSKSAPLDSIIVKQGWLESSNVDIVKEMVQMIELQRMFDMGSKVIHSNNETLDQTMKVGRFS